MNVTPRPGEAFAPMRLLGRVPQDGSAVVLGGTVLLADLSDFTGLTEALTAAAGSHGGEWVGRKLNSALTPVIDAVIDCGGEVVKFSGDGLLCVFADGEDSAGKALMAAHRIDPIRVDGPTGVVHAFRTALASGEVALASVGGQQGRRELVAIGAAVERALQLLSGVRPGCHEVARGVHRHVYTPRLPQEVSADAYLPDYVKARIALVDDTWLHELRTLTLAFTAQEIDFDADSLQPIASRVQRSVLRHGGQLLRFNVENSRLIAEVAFGLAVGGAATEAAHALQWALALGAECPRAHTGIAAGRVLLGPIGPAQRRQLTTLGSPVNLAARLMQRAAAGEVLVDDVAWDAAKARFEGRQDTAELKGLGRKVFWRLDAPRAAPSVDPTESLFGREPETHALRAALDAHGTNGPIVIEGEAGIGKSRLRRWLVGELRSRDIPVWAGAGTTVGRDMPYAALAETIALLCTAVGGSTDETGLRRTAETTLQDAELSPLFADAIGISLRDSDLTRRMTGQVRAENIRQALTALFASQIGATGCALVVDDAHWLDSATWSLLQRVASDLPALRLVVLTRPLGTNSPPELKQLRQSAALLLPLTTLPAAEISALMAHRIGISALPDPLARWSVERARGNPFFAEELASMLLAEGCVEVKDGFVVRTADSSRLRALGQVTTIEAALEQRIDRLAVQDAIVLKMASVIGPAFGLDALAHLASQPVAELTKTAHRLIDADMAVSLGGERYGFRHRYTQEAAYEMLPDAERRRLHRRTAQWFEARLGADADERISELAHHWFASGDRLEAAHWLEAAGARALRTGADREAATHFERALSVAQGQPPARVTAWHRQLARALFGTGEVQRVAHHARAALEQLLHAVPRKPAGWASMAAWRALARWCGIPKTLPDADANHLLEGARAAGLLAESAYFLHAPEMMVGSAFLAVDLAERTPDAAPVSAAYGMLGTVAGMSRLHGVAERYLTRARALSQGAGDDYQLGVAWFYTGMYHACAGQWDASLEAARKALALTERLNADMQSGFELTLIASNALYTSDYGRSRECMGTVRRRAERSSNLQQLGWSHNVIAVADLHQRHYDLALEGSWRAHNIFDVERDLVSLIISEGVQCAALARSDRIDEALKASARAEAMIAGAKPTTWGQLEGFAGPCEALALAAMASEGGGRELRGRFRQALRSLRLFVWVFPFGKPRYLWLCGLSALSNGRAKRAHRLLQRAAAAARHWQMPFEELRASELLLPLLRPVDQPDLAKRIDALKERVLDAAVHPPTAALLPEVAVALPSPVDSGDVHAV